MTTDKMSQTVATARPAKTPTLYKYQTMQWDASDFGEEWESLSDDDVRALLASIYPELGNAKARVETAGSGAEARRVVTFERAIGTKGAAAPAHRDDDTPGPDGAHSGQTSAAFVDPRPGLVWDAIASLPPLELRAYELAYDMQHLSLDEMLAKGDTLEGAIDEAEQEIGAVVELTHLLIPPMPHGKH